ncbi:MAG: hypothetical protein ACYS0G_04740 [Planctomycetota bacterium]
MVRPEPPRERYVPPVMADTKEGDTGRLVEFLQDRDAPCPLCSYNLRDLTDDVCPECRQKLRLTVGVHHVRFGWFLATVTPSLFSGIAAVLMLILILAALVTGAGPFPPAIDALELFGFASGVAALVLIVRRHRFIQLRPRVQRTWAMVAWGIHGTLFLGLVLLVFVTA